MSVDTTEDDGDESTETVTFTASSAELPRLADAKERGEVLEKSGYHQPKSGRRRPRFRCGCRLTTEKGAYRDVRVKLPDGRVVHYYHQTAVVVARPDGGYRLRTDGYRTATTKKRINEHTPDSVTVYQEDYEWFLDTPAADGEAFAENVTVYP